MKGLSSTNSVQTISSELKTQKKKTTSKLFGDVVDFFVFLDQQTVNKDFEGVVLIVVPFLYSGFKEAEIIKTMLSLLFLAVSGGLFIHGALLFHVISRWLWRCS